MMARVSVNVAADALRRVAVRFLLRLLCDDHLALDRTRPFTVE